MRHGRHFALRLSLIAVAVLVTSCRLSNAAAAEPKLLGCWRSQHTQLTFANRSPRDQNADCVFEYESSRVHLRCRNGNAVTDTVSSVEYFPSARMCVTPLVGTTGKSPAPYEMDYRIDGDWLITTRRLDAQPYDATKPERFTAMAVRIDKTLEGCRPRGETGLRIGRAPVSSLALSVPVGWEPWLVDPESDRELGLAIDTNFLVGVFVPKGVLKSSVRPPSWLLVVDDVRYGPTPVRAAEFANVKQRFARELGEAKSTCDLPDRACALLRVHEGGAVYTELVHVRDGWP